VILINRIFKCINYHLILFTIDQELFTILFVSSRVWSLWPLNFGPPKTYKKMTQLDEDEVVLKSLDKHMDSLKETVKSALLAAIAFWWAGVSGEDPLKIFRMTIPLDFVLYFVIVFYLFINLSILEKLTRISNITDKKIP